MRLSLTAALALAAAAGGARAHAQPPRFQHIPAAARQSGADILDASSYLASKFKNGDAPPGARPGDAPGQTVILEGQDASQNSQTAWCNNTIFIGSPQVNGSQQDGWSELPQLLGFDLKRDLHVGTKSSGGILPYYVETGKDPSKIKRLVVTQPGKPRDSWKYASLVRNDLLCAANNASMHVDLSTILIAAPAWQSNLEQKAGAVEPGSLYWGTAGWAKGETSRGKTSTSSFRAFDELLETFNRTAYPALNNIVLAGHSMGCSFTHRYAMLRKPNKNDPNLRYWYGNCGSYVWPTTDRPVSPGQDKCPATGYNDWPYGLDNVPAYAKNNFDTNATLKRYFGRKMWHALGALDDGPGDTNPAAQCQGSSHLERGQNLEKAYQPFHPGNFTLDILNHSHQDYPMLSDPISQQRLFVEDIDEHVDVPSSGSGSGSGASSASPSGSGSSAGSNPSSSSPSSSQSGAMRLTAAGSALLLALAPAVFLL